MALTKRLRGCGPALRPVVRVRSRPAHHRESRAWRRLVRDGRVYVAEPAAGGVLVTVLGAGEDGVRRVLLGGCVVALAAFLLGDATGRPVPAGRAEAFASDVLETVPRDRFVVTSLDLCCWTVVHAVLDERSEL
jgi:hypothetical protein